MAPNPKMNLKDKVDDGEMDLSMCDLQEVPVKEIAIYRKVHSLDLSNNHIITLPKNFATLTNLIKLDLSKNKLKSLPDNFGELTKLKHLDLYKNELEHLPLSFGGLKSLKWLDLKDNPLVPAIKEVAGQCLDSKQCQSCATSTIYFYAKLKEKVDLENETREKQRQKDKQANEVATQKLKHQEKKNKRKEKLKQQEEKQPVIEEKPLIVKTEINEKETTKTQKKSSSNLSRYIFFIFIFSVFFFICTSLKLKGTQSVEERVIEVWNFILNRAPPFIQEVGKKAGQRIFQLHQNLGQSLNELQQHEHFVYVSDKIKSYYDSFVSK